MSNELDKYKNKNSSRHHYIPQFLINGFVNDNGLLYVYDKQRDKILNKPKPPRSIFFETDRNTIGLNDGIQSSILEDTLYQDLDNIGSDIVRYYQTAKLNEMNFSDDKSTQFLFFLISLFWRIPYTDNAVNDLVDNAVINSIGIDSEILRNDETFRKSRRSGIMIHTIKEMLKNPEALSKFINLNQFSKGILVIGDNPLHFRKTSSKFSDFGKEDFLIALTSNRLYSSTKESFIKLNDYNAIAYNIAVINQSVRYVCCGELEYLEKSVRLYNTISEKGLNYFIAERPFRNEYKTVPNKRI
ncbi:DUF4238 domain-containing protein [Marinifilum fragile]|uniref:DUF4238 domain-containing protein n=1 Tax=Marinifilum fragile TaxID=570161 RepID=UPI002AABF8D4|nr:DUF4238 domain-containing protein [Marinifilum fragile]